MVYLIIVQCYLSPYFHCSIVNVPAVRWSPLLLSQPEDKDTQVQVNGQLPCVVSTDSWVNSGTLHIQSRMRSLLEIVRSQVGLPDGSARDNALNRRTLTVNKQKPKPSMPQEPHFCLAGSHHSPDFPQLPQTRASSSRLTQMACLLLQDPPLC